MKKKNSKTYWLIFIGIVLVAAVTIFCIWLPIRNKTKAPDSNQNVNTNQSNDNVSIDNLNSNTTNSNNNQALQDKIDQYSQAIVTNPENVQNYIDKSTAEYATGDKQAALNTVNEGLKIDPDNDLLKSRLDALEKNTFDNNVGAGRQ